MTRANAGSEFLRDWRRWPLPATMLVAGAVICLQLWRDHRESDALVRADPNDVLNAPALRRRASAIGERVYRAHCAACHGANGHGDPAIGATDFVKSRALYGDRVGEIEDIVRHGIRSPDSRGRHLASMPAYGSEQPYKDEPLPSLTPAEIEALTQYVLSFTHRQTNAAAVAEGATLFADKAGCWDCHGRDATGDTAIGAPDLTDEHWLYGDGSHNDVYRSISLGRAGYSPPFKTVLTAVELRAVAVYVASLRGEHHSGR